MNGYTFEIKIHAPKSHHASFLCYDLSEEESKVIGRKLVSLIPDWQTVTIKNLKTSNVWQHRREINFGS